MKKSEISQRFHKKNLIWRIDRLYDFPSTKTENINALLSSALVKKHSNRLKVRYGFISPKNIRLKLSKNKAFIIDENIKLKTTYEPKNKDLLIVIVEYNNMFAQNTYYFPLDYISSVCIFPNFFFKCVV